MRGIKVTSKYGKDTVHMCPECYKKKTDTIELAIEYNFIQKPVVTDIKQCEVETHCQEKEDNNEL